MGTEKCRELRIGVRGRTRYHVCLGSAAHTTPGAFISHQHLLTSYPYSQYNRTHRLHEVAHTRIPPTLIERTDIARDIQPHLGSNKHQLYRSPYPARPISSIKSLTMSRSGIESLPVELLQPIFLLSGQNVALLQASSRIAARLSSTYVYNSTCERHLTGVLDDCTTVSRSAAQTYIFASRWMTWTFFKHWILAAYKAKGCLCGTQPGKRCIDPQFPPNFENATNMFFTRSHLPQFAFMKARIPVKLLHGPWTTDKIQFLRFLLWTTSMTVDWHDEQVRSIAIEGRSEAMREKNLEVVELFNHNRRLGKFSTLSMVEYAVLECGCDRSIVYDTMATASTLSTISSWFSTKLDEWCEQRSMEGNLKGAWLKTKLEELRATSHPGNGDRLRYKQMPDGVLDSRTGDYDGGSDDRLVMNHHHWNQVRPFGFLLNRCLKLGSPPWQDRREVVHIVCHNSGTCCLD